MTKTALSVENWATFRINLRKKTSFNIFHKFIFKETKLKLASSFNSNFFSNLNQSHEITNRIFSRRFY